MCRMCQNSHRCGRRAPRVPPLSRHARGNDGWYAARRRAAMVNMGKPGETAVEVRLFDSARFYKTSSSAWSQEDAPQEPPVDDREWANWDDEEWAGSDDDEEEEEDGEDAPMDPAAATRTALSPSSSPAADPQDSESRRKLLVGATPGRPSRAERQEQPPPLIPSVAHGGEESGWGASYTNLATASPSRTGIVSGPSTPNEPARGSPRGSDAYQQVSDRRASPPEGRPLPAQPQPRTRSRGRYLGSAGAMGHPVRSRGSESDKGLEKETPAVRLSPSPASAPALDTGSLADMMAEAMAMVSPRTDPANGPSRGYADGPLAGMGGGDGNHGDHAEFLLPSIHGTKMSQLSQNLAGPQQPQWRSSGPALARGRPGVGRRRRGTRRRDDEERCEHDGHSHSHAHDHGGWGRSSEDDHDAGERRGHDQARLPSLGLGLVVTNTAAVPRAGLDDDRGDSAGGERGARGGGGSTQRRQKHPPAGLGGRRPGGWQRQNHRHRHRHRHRDRGRDGGYNTDAQQSLAVVSRRHGHRGGVLTPGGQGHQLGSAVSAEREPPPVVLTSAPQLQQNVLRQIEHNNVNPSPPILSSVMVAAAAAPKPSPLAGGAGGGEAPGVADSNNNSNGNSKSEARKQRQQLRLARGMP